MSTYIDGIAASQNIDTSGERIIIEGLDISSLVGSVFNWEHKSDQPSQIVGKILKAKKIFSEEDCEDERQKYYWSKCTAPYLYVMGELFDDYKDSAKEVAGMFRYDMEHKDKTPTDTIGFSIEGAKIDKKGMDITRSIARKVTITALPCNKAAVAEMVPSSGSQKDDLDDIFKTEHVTEINVFSKENTSKLLEMLKKEDPSAHAKILGIEPLKKADAVVGWEKHPDSSLSMKHPSGHKFKITQGTSTKLQHTAPNDETTSYGPFQSPEHAKTHAHGIVNEHYKMKKALTAGSGMGAPGSLVNGAALGKESMAKLPKPKTTPVTPSKPLDPNANVSRPDKGSGAIVHKPGKPDKGFGKIIYKNEWLKRAEVLYSKWDKREKFRSFMQKRLPTLAMGEIDAIGKTLVLSKSLKENPFSEFEQGEPLSYVQKALKFGSEADQKATEAALAERAKNPPKKAAPKKKVPNVREAFDSEVTHTTPWGGDKKYETVHLKSGHELDGHPAGKFKAGDKVSVKPHLMGTHLMDHKK